MLNPLEIPCPRCRVLAGESCKNYRGKNCAPHRERAKAVNPQAEHRRQARLKTERERQQAIDDAPLFAEARYAGASRVHLRFADGLSGEWSFQELELDMSGMKPTTIKASATGTAMLVKSKSNEQVEIDASSLRAMIDPAYKAELDEVFVALRGPLEDLIVTAPRRRRQTA